MQYNIIQYNIMQFNAIQYNSHYNDNLFIQLPLGKRMSANPSMSKTIQEDSKQYQFQAEVSRKWTSISEHNEGLKVTQPQNKDKGRSDLISKFMTKMTLLLITQTKISNTQIQDQLNYLKKNMTIFLLIEFSHQVVFDFLTLDCRQYLKLYKHRKI